MEYRQINGTKIPLIGLGTFGIGGGMSADKSHDREGIEAIQYGISLGMTHVDTAEMYGGGHSEELVGQAVKDFPRKDLFITTKVHPSHLEYEEVLRACQNSLKRLQLDCLDLYLVHWPNHAIPLDETTRAMDKLIKDGLTKFIGVSNFDVGLLKQAQGYSDNKIVADQVEYSLNEREPEDELLPYCQQNGIILTAYTPIKGIVRGSNKLVDQLAKKYDKTPAQIALNYLISQENVIAIPKAANKEHLKENAGSVGWDLSSEDLNLLKSSFD